MLISKSVTRIFRLLAVSFLIFQTLSFGNTQKAGKSVAPAGVQFAAGVSVSRIPFERVGNFIYLRARVKNSEPLWFLLDTGATASYFDVERAKSLGLGQDDFREGVSLDLPGVRLKQKFLPQRLGFAIYNGHAADGLLGFDFINRLVIEIDYVKNMLRLHEPNGYHYSGSGEVVPLEMLKDDSGGEVPLVRAKIMQPGSGAIEGKFIADTAVRIALAFNTPFVEANKLLGSAGRTIQVPLGGGAMVRESTQAIGRVAKIRLGRFSLRKPVAVFFQDKQGVVASPEFDGVIGAEILRRFNVIFDYSRQRMILEPTRRIAERQEYDMSGTLLIAEGKDFKTFQVTRILENSPASVAGLREGDIISAVNNKLASKLTLEQLRQMFKQQGHIYRLNINRNGQKIRTRIMLRRLI